MIKIIFILITFISVQFTYAQKSNTFEEYWASLKLTKEKAVKDYYLVREHSDHFAVWNSKYKLDSLKTNVDNIDRLPQLTLVNKELLDQFIERNMPKQNKAKKIKKNTFRIIFYTDNTGRDIQIVAFVYDNKLTMPITTIEAIETFLKTNCRLEFEANKVSQNANYIQYYYFYYLNEHEFPK